MFLLGVSIWTCQALYLISEYHPTLHCPLDPTSFSLPTFTLGFQAPQCVSCTGLASSPSIVLGASAVASAKLASLAALGSCSCSCTSFVLLLTQTAEEKLDLGQGISSALGERPLGDEAGSQG